MTAGEPTAKADGLVVRIGRRPVLDGISFELGQGAVVLAGPNGSGKSTLLRVLATLRRLSGGRAEVAGCSLRAARAWARSGVVPATSPRNRPSTATSP